MKAMTKEREKQQHETSFRVGIYTVIPSKSYDKFIISQNTSHLPYGVPAIDQHRETSHADQETVAVFGRKYVNRQFFLGQSADGSRSGQEAVFVGLAHFSLHYLHQIRGVIEFHLQRFEFVSLVGKIKGCGGGRGFRGGGGKASFDRKMEVNSSSHCGFRFFGGGRRRG